MSEEKLKYLEFIQANISRMSRASFAYKAWAIGSVTALIGAFFTTGSKELVPLSLVPLLVFWFLDGYHLEVERRFIRLYEKAINSDEVTFDLRPRAVKNSKAEILSTIFSPTLLFLYIPILTLVLVTCSVVYCTCRG